MYSEPRVTVTTEVGGGVATITCVGEFDLVGAPLLREAFDEVRAQGIAHVVVDLSGVGLLDSSGLAALVYGRRRVEDVAVRGLSDVTRAAFEATGLHEALRIL